MDLMSAEARRMFSFAMLGSKDGTFCRLALEMRTDNWGKVISVYEAEKDTRKAYLSVCECGPPSTLRKIW
jgi:hypothetical protein